MWSQPAATNALSSFGLGDANEGPSVARPATPSHGGRAFMNSSLECVEEDREVHFPNSNCSIGPEHPVLRGARGEYSGGGQAMQCGSGAGPFSISSLFGSAESIGIGSGATADGILLQGLASLQTAAPVSTAWAQSLPSRSPFLQCDVPFPDRSLDDMGSNQVSSLTASADAGSDKRAQRGTQQVANLLSRSASSPRPLAPGATSDLTSSLAAAGMATQQQDGTNSWPLRAANLPPSAGPHGGYSYTSSQFMLTSRSRLLRSASATELYTVPERRVRAGKQVGQALSTDYEGKIHNGLVYGSKDMMLASSLSLGSNNSPSNSQLPAPNQLQAPNFFTVRSMGCIPSNTSMASELGRHPSGRISGSIGRPSYAGSMDEGKVHRGVAVSACGSEKRVHGGLARCRGSKSSALDVMGTSSGGAVNCGPPSARSSITSSINLASSLLPAGSFGHACALAGSVDLAESLLSSLTRGGSGLMATMEADGIDDAWAAMFPVSFTPSPPVRSTLQAGQSSKAGGVSPRGVAGVSPRSVAQAGGGKDTCQDEGSSQHTVDSGSAKQASATASAALGAAHTLDLSRTSSSGEVLHAATTVPLVVTLARSPSLGVIYKVKRCDSTGVTPSAAAAAAATAATNGGSFQWPANARGMMSGSSVGWGSRDGFFDMPIVGAIETTLALSSPAGMLASGAGMASVSNGASPVAGVAERRGGADGFGSSSRQSPPAATASLDRISSTWMGDGPSPTCKAAQYSRRPSLLEYAEVAASMHQQQGNGRLSRGVSSGLQHQGHSGVAGA